MSTKSLETYLNDHLAGSRLGVDLARQIRDRADTPELRAAMTKLAEEIDSERDTLTEIMNRVGASENQVKQTTAWIAEKASRLKLSELGGILGGDEHYGLFMSIETLELGVTGKMRLWEALQQQAAEHEGLDAAELQALADQAREQIDVLERERRSAAARALAAD